MVLPIESKVRKLCATQGLTLGLDWLIYFQVWGCGGKGVKENQQKHQRWERSQAEKLQKVECIFADTCPFYSLDIEFWVLENVPQVEDQHQISACRL